MGYSAHAVANYFLDLVKRDGVSLSPLKLQKLVFIAHGWHLALTGMPLVEDEFAEAWQYGPVFPSLYHAFKRFGSQPVTEPAVKWDIRLSPPTADLVETTPAIRLDDTDTTALLNRIWNVYGHFSGLQLSAMTHAAETPWAITRKERGPVRNADISNDVIKTHYLGMAERNRRRREHGK